MNNNNQIKLKNEKKKNNINIYQRNEKNKTLIF